MNTARRLLLISASLPLFAAPAASFADDAAGMNACVNAFVGTGLSKEQKVRVKMLVPVRSPLDIPGRTYTVTLAARGAQSGKHLASATCVVERDGTVIALNGKPLTPALASR